MSDKLQDIPIHREHHDMLPVWFFIGILLLAYGIIILYAGVSEYSHPRQVILARYHASVWAGSLLTILGAFYTLKFRPRRGRKA
jgi:4-hydroxybenzoate polyprenyltransferase